jgi:hypothetical protein
MPHRLTTRHVLMLLHHDRVRQIAATHTEIGAEADTLPVSYLFDAITEFPVSCATLLGHLNYAELLQVAQAAQVAPLEDRKALLDKLLCLCT